MKCVQMVVVTFTAVAFFFIDAPVKVARAVAADSPDMAFGLCHRAAGDVLVELVSDPIPCYQPGDEVTISLLVTNHTGAGFTADVYVLLDIFGYYYFWPSWREAGSGIDHHRWYFEPGVNELVLLQFTWPQGAGSGEALLYAALMEPDTFIPIGNVASLYICWEP